MTMDDPHTRELLACITRLAELVGATPQEVLDVLTFGNLTVEDYQRLKSNLLSMTRAHNPDPPC